MNIICVEVSALKDVKQIDKIFELYGIEAGEDLKDFFLKNNGGIPAKSSIKISDKDYEIRCFMSFNKDEYNSIDLAIKSFQEETKGKIYPIAKDSGDNYYCINKETGKVYYWDKDENLYYCLADSFVEFLKYFE